MLPLWNRLSTRCASFTREYEAKPSAEGHRRRYVVCHVQGKLIVVWCSSPSVGEINEEGKAGCNKCRRGNDCLKRKVGNDVDCDAARIQSISASGLGGLTISSCLSAPKPAVWMLASSCIQRYRKMETALRLLEKGILRSIERGFAASDLGYVLLFLLGGFEDLDRCQTCANSFCKSGSLPGRSIAGSRRRSSWHQRCRTRRSSLVR